MVQDAGDFTIDEGNLTFKASPNYEMPGDADGDNVYKVTVGATDDDRNRGEMDVEVKVANVDEPGMVTLSTVQPRVGIALTASLTDIDGGVSGVTWQWQSNNSDIDDATSDTYTPIAVDLNDTLTAKAMYTDAQGPEKMAELQSANSVAADTRNKAPEFPDQDTDTEGTQNTEAKRTIAENAEAGTSLNGGGPVTATDSNTDDILTYTLGGPDASSFNIGNTDSDRGQITVGAGTKLNFEGKPTYMVTVIATDSFDASASIDVTITVTDENEGPMIMRGGLAVSGRPSIAYDENGTDALETYTASGPNADLAVWSLSGPDAGEFDISSSGVLSFATSPDFESPADMGGDNVYQVTVEADDGTYSDTHDVTVTVTNVAELGMVSGDASRSYPENGTAAVATYTADGPDAGMASWTLSGDDEGDFAISNGGELTFAASPDFEMPTDMGMNNVYQVTVEADAGGEMGTVAVSVTVINEDEDGTVTLSAQPVVGTELTASVTDPDGGVTGTTWQWASSDAADGTFASIAGATDATYTPVEGDDGMYLQATASYTDAEGEDKSATSVVSGQVTQMAVADQLLAKFDSNNDGMFDRGEVIAAIRQYLAGTAGVSRTEVIELIRRYLAGGN